MQSSRTITTGSQALLELCRSRIILLRMKYQQDMALPTRAKLLKDIRRYSVVIDHVDLTKFVHDVIQDILDLSDESTVAELGIALRQDPLGRRLIHEAHQFHVGLANRNI